VVAFRSFSGDDGDDVVVLTNTGDVPVELPPGDVLLTSSEMVEDGMLPGNTTVWLR